MKLTKVKSSQIAGHSRDANAWYQRLLCVSHFIENQVAYRCRIQSNVIQVLLFPRSLVMGIAKAVGSGHQVASET